MLDNFIRSAENAPAEIVILLWIVLAASIAYNAYLVHVSYKQEKTIEDQKAKIRNLREKVKNNRVCQ